MTVDSEDELGESSRAFNYLIEALIVSNHNYDAVQSFTELMVNQQNISCLSNQAIKQLLEHMNATAGAILTISIGEVKIGASQGFCMSDSLTNSDVVRRAFRTGARQSVSLPDDISIEGFPANSRPNEVMVFPLTYKDDLLGVIILASEVGFMDGKKSLLDIFCQSLSLALNNALTYDNLQNMAAHDHLTDIYNRRFGMERLSEEFSRARRTGSSLGVLMFDIDHFKKVNDTYGHVVGDRAIIHVTKIAAKTLREEDILMRYGGEEFLIVLPGTSKEGSRVVGERIRSILEDTPIEYGNEVIPLTISIGATSYPELEVTDAQELIKCADESLYQAKETGRNKVVVD